MPRVSSRELIVPVEVHSTKSPPPPSYTSGTRQYKRDCQLVIQSSSGKEFDLSSMRISFKVHAYHRNLQPKWLEARIYNVQKSTAEAILATKEGGYVRLEAGYEGNIGKIFVGEMVWVNIGRENPVDTFVDIWAGDGDNAHNFATVSKTFKKGSKPQDHWNEIVKQYNKFNIIEGVISNVDLSTPVYPRAFTLFGMASQALRVLAESKNAVAWVHMGKLNLSDKKTADQTGTIELNAMTGMIGMPVATTDGILVRALINPRFATDPPPNIHLNNGDINLSAPQFIQGGAGSAVLQTDKKWQTIMEGVIARDGIYQIYFVEFIGDTRGQPWYADITCATKDTMSMSPKLKQSQTVPEDAGP